METMMQQDNALLEEEFSNWAKAVLSLQNARDGSINYIKREMEQFVEQLQRMHGPDKKEHFKELLSKVAVNGKVNESKKPLPPKDRFVLADNSCTTCDQVFKKQLEAFKESRWHGNKWIYYSTEEQIDPSSYWWVLAKIYIAKPDIIDAVGPEEVEPSAIFKLISNCALFKNLNVSGEKLVNLRNELMHSANNRLTRQKMTESFDLIKEFLKLVAHNITDVINEVEKLEKSTVVLFEENGEFSKLAKEALQLQHISLNADLDSPEGIKRLAIKSLGTSNLEIKQQDMKLEKLRKEKEQQDMELEKLRKVKEQQDIELEELRKVKEQQDMELEKFRKEKECGVWHNAHIDDLNTEDKDMPSLRDMQGKYVGGLMSGSINDTVPMEIDEEISTRTSELDDMDTEDIGVKHDVEVSDRSQYNNDPLQLDDVLLDL